MKCLLTACAATSVFFVAGAAHAMVCNQSVQPPAVVADAFTFAEGFCPDATWRTNQAETRFTAVCGDDARTRITFNDDGLVVRWAETVNFASFAALSAVTDAFPDHEIVRTRRIERFVANNFEVLYGFALRNDGERAWVTSAPDGELFNQSERIDLSETPVGAQDYVANFGSNLEVVRANVATNYRGVTRYRVRVTTDVGCFVFVFDDQGQLVNAIEIGG